jgi:predicted nucleic acid-binding protein
LIRVIDASVAAKWFFAESGDRAARALAESGDVLIAPHHLVPEVCNVAWQKAVSKQITAGQAQEIGLRLPTLFNRLIPGADLACRATELAVKLRHPVYDCFYLALAETVDCTLVTADRKFLKLISRAGGDPHRITILGGDS